MVRPHTWHLREEADKAPCNKIIGAKHEMNINDSEVVCAVSAIGTSLAYTLRDQEGLFDKADMVVPINSVTCSAPRGGSY